MLLDNVDAVAYNITITSFYLVNNDLVIFIFTVTEFTNLSIYAL